VSVFPQIRRDLSFAVDAGESFSRIEAHVKVAASTHVRELRLFDVYTGKGVESGRKSVALGLILQDVSRTLTDEEADRIVADVVASLSSGLNAKLRE
jgi:phenylalanyl-tRNA synthetase beta chain